MLSPEENTAKAEAPQTGDGNVPLDPSPLPPAVIEKLDAIRAILDRMLVLAMTSADAATADAERAALQQELDRLRREIDDIADGLG